MYEPLVFIHSWMRWVVLVAGIYLVLRFAWASYRETNWKGRDAQLLWAFDQSFGYQFLFGLVIWAGLSPWSKALFHDIASLDNPMVFFFSLRHPLTMLLAMILFQVLKDKAMKEENSTRRFRKLAVAIGLPLIVILSAIPWPWMDVGRSLFRGLS